MKCKVYVVTVKALNIGVYTGMACRKLRGGLWDQMLGGGGGLLNEGVGGTAGCCYGNGSCCSHGTQQYTCHRQVESHVPCCSISMRHSYLGSYRLHSCSEQYSSWDRRVLVCARV